MAEYPSHAEMVDGARDILARCVAIRARDAVAAEDCRSAVLELILDEIASPMPGAMVYAYDYDEGTVTVDHGAYRFRVSIRVDLATP